MNIETLIQRVKEIPCEMYLATEGKWKECKECARCRLLHDLMDEMGQGLPGSRVGLCAHEWVASCCFIPRNVKREDGTFQEVPQLQLEMCSRCGILRVSETARPKCIKGGKENP